MLRRTLAATTLLLLGGVLVAAPARGATLPPSLPGSMAAVGDSITRAFNVNGSHYLSDAPSESWSTGTDTTLQSEYQRLFTIDPAVSGHAYNDAKTGATMAALGAQLTTAAGQGADYVTVLMGANDVCGRTVGGMTPTATFASEFDSALAGFTQARPNATVFVSSIPNVYQLWSLLHTNGSARFAWSIYGICQNMLGSSVTEAQRQTVLTQLKADNDQLAAVCKKYAQCRWDGYATFDYAFTAAQVSTVDYFHPSIAGQRQLADLAWKAGPFAG